MISGIRDGSLILFLHFFFLPFSGPSGKTVGPKAPYALSFYTKVAELTGERLVMMTLLHKTFTQMIRFAAARFAAG